VEVSVDDTRLLGVDRLALAGALAGAIGHELNNVLSVLVNALHFVREDLEEGNIPDPTDLAGLAHVERQIAAHAKHLLGLTRPRPPCIEPADLVRVVDDAVGMLRAYTLKRVTVALALPDEPLLVAGDAGELAHAVTSLALRAGEAALASAAARRPPEIAIALARTGARATLTVRDNGAGVAPAGELALQVIDLIAARCGGRLSLHAEPGCGTTFALSVPLAKP